MMNSLSIKIALLMLLPFLLAACYEVEIDELETTWGRVLLTSDTSDYTQQYQEWKFSGGKLYVAFYYQNSAVIYDTATYTKDKKYSWAKLKYESFITIRGLYIHSDSAVGSMPTGITFGLDYSGKWQVDKLEDGVFAILRTEVFDDNGNLVNDASFMYLEFIEK